MSLQKDIEGIPSKDVTKKRKYYCSGCEVTKILPNGRWWHNCYNPGFMMTTISKKEALKLIGFIWPTK